MSNRRLAEQFSSFAKQDHAWRLGMWTFLASELLLFAGLFALYAAYRTMYPEEFAVAAAHDNVAIGTGNTLILLTSSLTVALATMVVRSRVGKGRVVALLLFASVLFGGVFLCLKGIEYREHFREGIFPGRYYRNEEMTGYGHHLFFTLYYFTTGLHALHVTAGMTVLAYLGVRSWRGAYSPDHHLPVELGGLYWHLVDVVWIFLWPVLYLAR